jgi:uncharacterized cupredoxin-like copper-binding protein
MRTISALLSVLLLSGVVAAAACGAQSQPAGSVKVTLADFSFAPSSITGKAGENTFFLVNEGKASHDMTIKDGSGKQLARSELVQPGNTAIMTVKLDAGSYEVICSQQGHADAGMKATLTVS